MQTPHTDNETEITSNVNASISQNGSEVFVTCQFPAGYTSASCVLVYREYTNTTLNVKVYDKNTMFPVSITIEPGMAYTFAIFERNGSKDIDEVPMKTIRVTIEATEPTDATTPPPGKCS